MKANEITLHKITKKLPVTVIEKLIYWNVLEYTYNIAGL